MASTSVPDLKKELTVPRAGYLYWIMRGMLALTLKGLKITVEGLEKIPEGKAIIAPNHTSNLDPPLIGTAIPEACHFAAKSQMFKPVIGWFLRRGLTHPVRRGGSDTQALRLFRSILESDQKMIMFPEGTRSLSGELQPLKTGVATLAVWTGAPVVPVAIKGARDIWPPGQKWPRWRGEVRILIGDPISVKEGGGKEEVLRVTNEMTEALTRLIKEVKNCG
jgi:1-acyl-sn-glycerol-3-phosphate acyltransferase